MTVRVALRVVIYSLVIPSLSFAFGAAALVAQNGRPAPAQQGPKLQFVLMLSRHGVRSPLGEPTQYDKYSAAPWPKWEVPPGILTPHGYDLMKAFGAWDRTNFAQQGLFAATGCTDAQHVAILADSDERTRETGKALAEGMFPGCEIAVHAKAEGTVDPLYRLDGGPHSGDRERATAAIAGRIGGDANHLAEAFKPQLTAMDNVLAGCGHAAATDKKRVSVFDIPASVGGGPEFSFGYRGPVATTATMAENLLLEYTDGKSDADVGWGCVDGTTLRSLMQLDTASWEYNFRTQTVAHIYASNLLDHIERTIEQGVTGKPVTGALASPDNKLVILVGHDTNIVTVAGALGINWIIDGRADDTPPGGALLFEVWRPADGGWPFVRVEYAAQTLEQMRLSQVLTADNPPALAPVFLPECTQKDGTCTWEGFSAAMHEAIDPEYVILASASQ